MSGLFRRIGAPGCGVVVLMCCAAVAMAQNAAPPDAPISVEVGNGTPANPPSRWPLHLDVPEGQITIYQPQLTSFDGNQIKARAAVSVVAPGQTEPTFGAMWMESRVETDRVARTVHVLDVTVTRVRFPGAGGVTEQTLTTALRNYNAQQGAVTLSLDQILAMVEVIDKEKAAVQDIATTPPQIIFVNHPAVLVPYDGKPRLMDVENSTLIRAVNTPFFVVLDPGTRTYYLKGANLWYAAPDPMGPFQTAAQVPPAVVTLANNSGYQDPQAPLQGVNPAAIEIITSSEPTELIWTDGAEEMSTIPNTDLLYVTNTPSDVFLQIDTQQIFVLLSGRWYTAPNHNGPWTFVPPDKLPSDFARIPPTSEKGSVLASVAGTVQAKDAVADTMIPQTAAIDRHNFQQPPVTYDGDPNFAAIENCPVTYAVNCPIPVLGFGGRYYCCYNAVWYQGGAALGPWDICTSVPNEIYTIPPTCPDYSVRYCYVYDSTPDIVYVGYTPGYVGCYPYDHVVVFGTGYHYNPWVGHFYYPRPWTFGFSARYDAYSGHWGFSIGDARGGGLSWFGSHEWHGSGGWFGHGGYRPITFRNEVNIRESSFRGDQAEITRQSLDLYQRRKDVRRDLPIRAAIRPEPARVEAVRPVERNDVFAGPNGEVYRKTIDGWEQRDSDNKWSPRTVEPARQAPVREAPMREAPVREQPQADLNGEYRARMAGQQRARNYPAPEPAREAPREAPRDSGGGRGAPSPGGNQRH